MSEKKARARKLHDNRASRIKSRGSEGPMICIVRAWNSRDNIGSRPRRCPLTGLSTTSNRNRPAFAPLKAVRERNEILPLGCKQKERADGGI